MESSTSEIFSKYYDYLKSEQETREELRAVVTQLEQTSREMLTLLQRVHQNSHPDNINQICEQATQLFNNQVQQQYQALAKLVSKDYYRFSDHWRFVTQRFCFLAAFVVYLKSDGLITREQAATLLGVAESRDLGFHIDLEDFLNGLLSLASELARFAVNSVTSGNYDRPMKISKFVGDLNAGFRLLNLKNDSLRKRFDALKYDMKKIEEVVYDLSIRGLKPAQDSSPDSDDIPKERESAI